MTEPANPLLDRRALPRFDAIRPEHVEPGMTALLADLHRDLDRLEQDCGPEWSGVVEGLERLRDTLEATWGVVGHLMGVRNSAELRQAHDAVQPEVVRFDLRLSQSARVYEALCALRQGPRWVDLEPAQRRVVDTLIRDADLAGVGLRGAERQRFLAIETELAELATKFSNNVLDATKAFALLLTTPAEAEGLPPSLRSLAAQAARAAGAAEATAEAGPWRITLDGPSLVPFLMHSRRRDLRRALYLAHVTRASAGELDNAPLITRILRLRREKSRLLGYATYAALSLASKMAPGVGAVRALEEELLAKSRAAAEADLRDIQAQAARAGAPEAGDMRHWDVSFWAERLREERYAFSEEELRPYLPLPRVLDGLFALAGRLFGVSFIPADGETPVWHPDVRFFRVRDGGGDDIAACFLDPYSRPDEKNGGAWMDVCVGRSRLLAPPGHALRLPVAYLTCNGTPPVGGRPSLLTFDEVLTLFHEFGHGLQHMLTRVDWGLASGLRGIEWDAVEIASQFMENWCYDHDTLTGLSGHVDTGDRLPEALYEKIVAARRYRAGSDMLRQVRLGLTDLDLHERWDPDGAETPFAVAERVAARAAVMPPLPEDRFLCGFQHIFAGSYAAGYYSYKWSEVLSADAFAVFAEAHGPEATAAVGRRWRDTVLAEGGGRHPLEVFRAFAGRDPSTEPLLRQYGLLPAEGAGGPPGGGAPPT